MFITEEMLHKHPNYTRRNSDGKPMVNNETLVKAPDDIYFELMPTVRSRFRAFKSSDGIVVIAPPKMALYAFIDREVGLTAVYAVDEMVRFSFRTPLGEILFTPPSSWSQPLRNDVGVGHISNVRNSVFVPSVPYA